MFSILDLPDEKPRITGIKEKYQIGETLEALCTSWHSAMDTLVVNKISETLVFLIVEHAVVV